MKVLMVEPGKIPHEADIEPGLRSLQAAVGGNIQAVYPYEDPMNAFGRMKRILQGSLAT